MAAMPLEKTHAGRLRVHTVSSLVERQGELTEEDAAQICEHGPSMGPELTQIRLRHHKVAKLVAAGLDRDEVADLCGYAEQTVTILLLSPAFKNLVEHYRAAHDGEDLRQLIRLTKETAHESLRQLHKRLHLGAEKIPARDLGKITSDLLDRSGVGPTASVKVSHGISAETLEAIKHGAQASRTKVIDIDEEGVRTRVGEAGGEGASPGRAEGEQGGGDPV
jgi:hypothetical protein